MTAIHHAPSGYVCPFCAVLNGQAGPEIWSVPDDLVYRDGTVSALMAASGPARNPGHVLVIPNTHTEHLYDLPERDGAAIFRVTRAVARALRATSGCTGVSTRQHNEPHGNQDVWHLHVHVYPRFAGDELYAQPHVRTTPAQRQPYAQRLCSYLALHPEVFEDLEATPS
jgi:histidine triad (HIT) family protein